MHGRLSRSRTGNRWTKDSFESTIEDSDIVLLDERYTRGQISREEYQERKRQLAQQ